jgi:hypothetical protein
MLFMFLLKDESDQFRSFWTIFRLRSYPIVTKSLQIYVEDLLFYKSINTYMIVFYKIVVNYYKVW